VEEGADQAVYWRVLLLDAGLVPGDEVKGLVQEAGETVAMTVASIKTARRKKP